MFWLGVFSILWLVIWICSIAIGEGQVTYRRTGAGRLVGLVIHGLILYFCWVSIQPYLPWR